MRVNIRYTLIILIVFLAIAKLTTQQCKPYYPRIFWNPSS